MYVYAYAHIPYGRDIGAYRRPLLLVQRLFIVRLRNLDRRSLEHAHVMYTYDVDSNESPLT